MEAMGEFLVVAAHSGNRRDLVPLQASTSEPELVAAVVEYLHVFDSCVGL